MDGISIGDWFFTPADLLIAFVTVVITTAILLIVDARVRASMANLLFRDSFPMRIGAAAFLLAANIPLMLLRNHFQYLANRHIEPLGYLLTLIFITLSIGVIVKSIRERARIARAPAVLIIPMLLCATMMFWAYQFLIIEGHCPACEMEP